jgi:uncharacterized protein YuzE
MINYDEKYDVMYLSVEPNEMAGLAKECYGNILLRYSVNDKTKLVGITIFDFKRFIRLSKKDVEMIPKKEKPPMRDPILKR